MASPAQIANDMAAHAGYWHRRDRKIEALCRQTACLIRDMLAGEKIDGRRYRGVWRRLLDSESRYYARKVQGWPDFSRARACIENLKNAPAMERASNG